jgi:hypothetical protein
VHVAHIFEFVVLQTNQQPPLYFTNRTSQNCNRRYVGITFTSVRSLHSRVGVYFENIVNISSGICLQFFNCMKIWLVIFCIKTPHNTGHKDRNLRSPIDINQYELLCVLIQFLFVPQLLYMPLWICDSISSIRISLWNLNIPKSSLCVPYRQPATQLTWKNTRCYSL